MTYLSLQSVYPDCTSQEGHEQMTFVCFNATSETLREDVLLSPVT